MHMSLFSCFFVFGSFLVLEVRAGKSPSLRGGKSAYEANDVTSGRTKRRLKMKSSARKASGRLFLGEAVGGQRLLSERVSSVDYVGSTCIANRSSLPLTWKASEQLELEIDNFSKPADITLAAEQAARGAFSELVEIMKRPGIIEDLGTDALEPIINGAFAGGNMPDIREVGLTLGQEILVQLAQRELKYNSPTCAGLRDSDLPTLVQYGRYLQLQAPPNATLHAVQGALVNATNEALDNCSSLQDYLGFNPRVRLSRYPTSIKEVSSTDDWIDPVYSMVLQAVDTLGLLGIESLNMPDGALEYVASFWAYLFDYPFPRAEEYPDGIHDPAFEQNSYIVTHLAYVVTGYQRYELAPNDASWLFRYLRENFYSAVESGHLDLYAEFLDNFRQYGCTSLNDKQTMDGTLVLLERYREANGRWTDYRDPDDDAELEIYDVMHKAWTAYVGLHRRELETPPPGISYFQQARKAVQMALKKVEAKRGNHSHNKQPDSLSCSVGKSWLLGFYVMLIFGYHDRFSMW